MTLLITLLLEQVDTLAKMSTSLAETYVLMTGQIFSIFVDFKHSFILLHFFYFYFYFSHLVLTIFLVALVVCNFVHAKYFWYKEHK